MVEADDPGDDLEPGDAGKQLRAPDGVTVDHEPVACRQRTRLRQDRTGHPDLAEIVKRRREPELKQLGGRCAKRPGSGAGGGDDPV